MWRRLTWTRSGIWATSLFLNGTTSVRGASFTCSSGSRITLNGSDTQRQAGHDSGDTSTCQDSMTVPARPVRPTVDEKGISRVPGHRTTYELARYDHWRDASCS